MYGIYCLEINTTVIGGITTQSLNLNPSVVAERASGELYARQTSLAGQRPMASLSTRALKLALDNFGLNGLDIATSGPVKLYAYAHADGGTRETGSVHTKYTVSKGIIVPRVLSCAHQGDATLSFDIYATYDGSNAPILIATAAVPTAVGGNVYTLGPVTLGGETLTRIRSLNIDFGITVQTEGADSDIWDTESHITQASPTIMLTGIDIGWFDSGVIPLAGLAMTHANTEVWLRKRAPGATFVPDATAEHIKFTAAGMVNIAQAFSATGDDIADVSAQVSTVFDGTNNPLVINTAAAISA